MPSSWASARAPPHRLRRAAALLAVVLRVRPQFERDRDRLGAALAHEQRRNGAVDPSAHRHERAPGAPARAARTRARPGPSARCSASAASSAACSFAGAQPAELLGDLLRADPRRLEQCRAREQRHRGAAGRDRSRRSRARRIRRRRSRPRPLALGQGQRDAHEVAARGSAGGAGEGALGRVPARRAGSSRWLLSPASLVCTRAKSRRYALRASSIACSIEKCFLQARELRRLAVLGRRSGSSACRRRAPGA